MNLDVVMPLSVDSQDRINNALIVSKWLEKLQLTLIVVQQGNKYHNIEWPSNTTSIFQYREEKTFNKCRAMNVGYKLARQDVVMQIDADCMLHQDDIKWAYQTIKTGECNFIFPHNGEMLEIPKCYHNLHVLEKIIEHEIRPNDITRKNPGIIAHGGAFMFSWHAFYRCGMEDQSLYGYGAEDTERWMRLVRLGEKTMHARNPFWHLEHERPDSEWYTSTRFEDNYKAATQWHHIEKQLEIQKRIEKLKRDFDPGRLWE